MDQWDLTITFMCLKPKTFLLRKHGKCQQVTKLRTDITCTKKGKKKDYICTNITIQE